MKKNLADIFYASRTLKSKKIIHIMKLWTVFTFVCVLQLYAVNTYSQKTTVNIQKNSLTLNELITEIEKQTDYLFIFSKEDIDLNRQVTINGKNHDVVSILADVFNKSDIDYTLNNTYISLRKKELVETSLPQQEKKTLTGKIVDPNGEPVIGANVVEKGTTNGTITDMDGNFNLSVSPNSTLTVSYIGFNQQEIAVTGKNTLAITLQEDAEVLEEVVVVGYGTQKKVNLTGSIASVDSKTLMKRQVGQTSLALQGAAPGVTVTQRSGQPGLDAGDIKIRGVGTLNNSSPLVLVDGLEMGINNIDVSTIESISVLKDAASSSIYGSKAANGVILITTKRASEGKFNISYSGYIAQQSPTNLPNKLNAIDHILLLNESKVNAGAGVVYTDEQIQNWKEKGSSDRDSYPDTDWQKEILKGSGLQQNHSLTLTGGTDKLKVLASLGYLKQYGIIDHVDFERISVRLNTDFAFTKNFSSSLDLFIYNSNRNSVSKYESNSGNSSGTGYIFFLMNKLPAVQAAKYANGNYAEGQNGENPVASIYQGGFTNEKSTPITGNISFKWEPHKDFSMQTVFSPSISYPLSRSFVKQITTYNPDGSIFSQLPSKSQLTEQSDYSRYLQSRTTANYHKTIGLHSISALAGFQYESNYSSGFNAFRDDFAFPDYTVLQSGSVENMKNDGWAGENVLLSWFGRVNYDYKSKYLLEANIRYDGSSKFAKGKKWGAFPSFSAGWRLSEEAFWNNLRENISNVKIRASWGTLGNQNIGNNYPFSSNINMSTKYISEDKLVDGAAVLTMNNPNITWETTTMSNIGMDINLWNKLNVSVDWFHKKTKDILMLLDIPGTMGLEPTYQNAGVVENNGYDLNITYSDRIGEFDFDVSFNLSDVKNKITDLKGINGTGLVTNREGYSINSLYMRKSLGILTSEDFNDDGSYKWERQGRVLAPGDLRYANLNDDDIVNADDREVLGSTIPRYTFGLNLNGRYKGFDLNVMLQGVGKVDGYLSQIAMYPFWSGGTAFSMHKDRWTQENQNVNASFPRLYFYDSTNNYLDSDFYMKSAAYLRVKNIQLGYKIPTSISKKMLMEHLRFYISGENLFTFTNFWDGWDPEVSPASSGAYYPQVKTISFGVDVRF
ncbi:TonB-dependent receptor [Massilibacteroides sp.]|uniref:TonB-dependent receptor n=1 Tax=Massilibacteroides sp. TaxID=2034766 RepID=UPI0026024892|nr:TonB-dependent receptor [Massilibacteroides sp.]MDD4514048.1 TonB-dependent receptor [Massilibacteroides sp.]